MISAIVIGFGNRGYAYTRFAKENPDKLKIVGIVEPDDYKRSIYAKEFAISKENCFSDLQSCLAAGKIADAAINTTMDKLHVQTTVPLLEKGYDVLLEKPITSDKKELLELAKCAEKNKRNLLICHVLRYTPFYKAIKNHILKGDVGEVVHIETSEVVGYVHAATAYLRGKWKNSKQCGSSMLLAKCCHDLDLICWLNNKTVPSEVASFGGREYFIGKNAPKDSGKRCFDCKAETDCPFSAKKMHLNNDIFRDYIWNGFFDNQENLTVEEKSECLKTINPHGECIFKTTGDIVDRQTLIIHFSNGSVASHTMLSAMPRAGRKIHVYGTKGEIEGYFEDNKYILRNYDDQKLDYTSKHFDLNNQASTNGHGGGDMGLVSDFIALLDSGKPSISATTINDSVYGHLCVYAADESMQKHQIIRIDKL